MQQQTFKYVLLTIAVLLLILFIVLLWYRYNVSIYEFAIFYVIIIVAIVFFIGVEMEPEADTATLSKYSSKSSSLHHSTSTKDIKPIDFNNIASENYDIGGLDEQLKEIFRTTLQSRYLPKAQIKAAKLKHNKGVILYGPPGTGKTTIVRKLADLIKAKDLQYINGPEIYSKWVGNSEENIRNIFKPIKEEYRKYGENAELFIVCIDEIDAICGKRGNRSDSGVSDKVVNQLITEIDGLEEYDNFIIFGTTNRLDMLDTAILRPGRFDVKIKIPRPNYQGRLSILKVLTKGLAAGQMVDNNIDFEKIAKNTEDYTGADLSGVIKNAFSHATNRFFAHNREIPVMINNEDIENALKEIKPILTDEEIMERRMEKFSARFASEGEGKTIREGLNNLEDLNGLNVPDFMRDLKSMNGTDLLKALDRYNEQEDLNVM